jgi:hypothetical protein
VGKCTCDFGSLRETSDRYFIGKCQGGQNEDSGVMF